MWPFDEAPVARVKDALGVTLDARWLDHLRDASVRLTNGCSASIVSRGGLILTNQHCIVGCAEQVSPPERDYVAEGFVAGAPAEERTCPDVQAEVLVAIADVTAPIYAAGTGKLGEDFAAGPPERDRRRRARRLRGRSALPLPGDQLLPGRPVQGLQVPPLRRRAAGVRAGVRRGLVRRRPGQLQLPALRPRLRVPAALRKRQAGRDARLPGLVQQRAAGRRAGVRLRQSGRHRAAPDRRPARGAARCLAAALDAGDGRAARPAAAARRAGAGDAARGGERPLRDREHLQGARRAD